MLSQPCRQDGGRRCGWNRGVCVGVHREPNESHRWFTPPPAAPFQDADQRNRSPDRYLGSVSYQEGSKWRNDFQQQ